MFVPQNRIRILSDSFCGGKKTGKKLVESPRCKLENQQHTQPIHENGSEIRMLGDKPCHLFAIPACGKCHHARCGDVFLEDKDARKAAWSVHQSILHISELATSGPCWDFRKQIVLI